ncbi:glycosyltransferase family 4 protein [Flavilitoribacter nigricans]|uniref:Group 1 glycosyl transferase n=1 Tax=Flavilitoribacter nigricans (strain ATCC 23147 / DSM 23189 / NBRC 102662 / NCIMB 1420 / SS-2) TaxID=1122177 RepID=A0A2D0MXB2_FLAN2|nr:glycosyltransferase family 1 protein [Flavilitoribacter nigricans]PHN00875.1 group 1 glycosyl transferase [Flavilitoribacter nigricans DSM 23189 = NBRC 102662]
MFRIGFDAKRLFNNFTGLGNYSRTLVANLATYYPEHAYFLFTPKLKPQEETHFFQNDPLFSVQTAKGKFAPLWRMSGIIKDLKKQEIQLYHGLSHELPLKIQQTKIKTVVTIHDLLFKRFPNQYAAIDRNIYNGKFRYACHYADRIVAISEATKRDIIQYYSIAPEKIQVIYQSCHERFMQTKSHSTIQRVLDRYQLPAEYLLYVGSIIERKNLLGIIKAMELLRPSFQLPLVVVGGGKGAYRNKVKNYIAARHLQDRIHFIQPESSDLPALYQQASIFLYPSYGEGFGIPILESLFSKTPVITSKVSSLPEAAGPDAYLVDPGNIEAIRDGIEGILSDDQFREQMIEKGYIYAQQFRGEPLTHQMMGLYQELLD